MTFGGVKRAVQLFLVACVAVSLGAAQSGMPMFTVDPQNMTVDLGETVTLNCSYDSMNNSATDVTITWSGPDGIDVSNTAPSNTNGVFTSVLTLTSVTVGHAGMYQCSASDDNNGIASVQSMEATLTVSYFTVMFDISSYSFMENAVSANVMVVAMATGIPTDGLVTVTSSDGTAEAGSDYVAVNSMLTLSTSGTQNVAIPIIDDNILEFDEQFSVNLALPAGPVVIGSPNTANVTIENDDMPEFITDPQSRTVDLGETNVTLSCDYDSRNVTAADVTITWSGPNEIDVSNTVISNTIGPGVFTSVLTLTPITMGHAGMYQCSVSGDNRTVQSMEATLTVSYYTVSFSTPTITVNEEDDVALAMMDVTVTGTPSRDGMVDVNATDGTAEDEMDYSLPMSTFTVTPTTTTVQVPVNIHEDSLVEENETLTINLVSMDGLVLIGSPPQATITIVDNDVNPPMVDSNPVSIDNITAGSDVNFTVMASGIELSYQWQRERDGVMNLTDGVEYDGATTDTLTVLSVDNNDEGVYSCIVSNDGGSVTSAGANLTVFDIPVIVIQPMDLIKAINSTATFTVTITSTSPVTYQWFFENGTMIENAIGASYTIDNVTEGDYGGYFCRVTNEDGDVMTRTAQLSPLPPPEVSVDPPLSVLDSAILPADVTINCTVTYQDEQPTIVWSMDPSDNTASPLNVTGVDSPPTSSGDRLFTITSTLVVNVADLSYRGEYTCEATNEQGTNSSSASIRIITIENVANVTVPLGVDAVFTCSAEGSEGISYEWSPSQSMTLVTLPESLFGRTLQRFSPNNTATFTIETARPSDVMFDYTCIVSVDGVEGGQRTGALDVQVFSITEGPLDQTVTMGDDVTLNCTAENVPGGLPVQFVWGFIAQGVLAEGALGRNASTLPNAVQQPTTTSNDTYFSQFVIANIRPEDAGLYHCRAFVPPMNDSELFMAVPPVFGNVVVQFSPRVYFADGDNPVLNGLYVADVNGPETLIRCVIVAVPGISRGELVVTYPDMTNDTVATSDNPGGEQKVTLFVNVTDPTLEQNGTRYDCTATNVFDDGSNSVVLVVRDVPDSVNHTNSVSVPDSLVTVTITWDTPNSNNDGITGYRVTLVATNGGNRLFDNINLPFNSGSDQSYSFSMPEAGRTSLTVTGLTPGESYSLTVRAMNSLGPSRDEGTEMFMFDAATLAQSQPVGLAPTIITDTGVVLSWTLPSLALPDDVMVDQFQLRVDREGGGGDNEAFTVTPDFTDGRGSPQAAGVSGLEASSMYTATLFAEYSAPGFTSPTVRMEFTTLTAMEAATPITNDDPFPPSTNTTDALVISWPPASNQNFLTQYLVEFSITDVSARRRRRQATMSPLRVDGSTPSARINNPEAYSNYSFDVSSVYQPPGSNEVIQPLLPTFSFTSAEGFPGSPRNLRVANRGIHTLNFTWLEPFELNGVLHSYAITIVPMSTSGGARTEALTTTDTFKQFIGLPANTGYTATVRAFTKGGMNEGAMTSAPGSTDFGVVQPVIAGITLVANNRLRVVINPFSSEDGPLSQFFVVVSRSALTSGETNAIANLSPYDLDRNNDIYVVFADSSSTSQLTRDIGTGSPSTFGGDSYPNPQLEDGRTYYVFVRLYSSVDATRFSDSRVILEAIPSPVNPAVIIGPIAAFAILLLAVLIVLLVVAFFMMRSTPKKRAYSPGQMDGLLDGKRKKKGHPIELRRTRLFSPTLNVGEENVFTSTGQPTTLICEASGTPAPEVSWTHNEEPLDKERFIQLADASLFINDTDMQDEGSYLVKATNSAGSVEQLVRVTVIRPVPPEPDSEHPTIPVGEFTEKIALLRANDDEGLEDEYTDVEMDWTFTSYAAKLNINKNKNRYVNIIPYDHSRVVMALQDNTPGTDYINASYIDGYNHPNAYIATQGPIPSTFADFWRMIWELDSPTIVMVTNLKEEDKVKCHQYWPSYGTTTYGNIQVTLKNVENLAEYSIRTFNVTPLAGQSRAQMPVREVRQFHFLVWPDHGVPQYATALLSFRKRVVTYHPEKRGPMVVHCSAGVGRTGTFITIDVVMKQIEAEGIIDIFNFVRHMRFRRNYMVQTSPQYVFIHDAVLEAIMCGDSTIPTLELREKIISMLNENPETGKNEFQQQFETLNAASPPDEDFDCSIAMVADNMAKNRNKEHLPPNDYRVVLSSEGDQSDYICASFVDNYRQRSAFMVTQAPMESTIGDFWRMVWEHKSGAIVMLTELEEDGTELCVKYWPSEEGEAGLFGAYQVELSEAQKDRGDYITRRFKVSPVDKPQESRMVTQFHFTSWSRTSVPSTPRSIVDLIDELQRVQRKSGNGPITVHCDDGISRTGAFCTLCSVLERVKIEQVVDVFQAIKHLRIQRAGLLSSVDQYIFIHKAVVEFLDTFSDYQNFK